MQPFHINATPFAYCYRHLLGDICPEDMELLHEAEWKAWEDMPEPSQARDPRVARAIKDIALIKRKRAECYI